MDTDENNIAIGFAKISDVTEIGNLSRKYIEHDLGWKYTPGNLTRLINDKTRNVVVARSGVTLTGFGIMTYHYESANLDLLGVKRQYQRKGIGRKIVCWLEEVALNAGIFSVFIQVRKINNGAISFYETIGYEIIDEKSGYYQDRETAVIMSKNISKKNVQI